ncbi:MAG: DNA polymerase IV [Clostridia bacterium]|nr:DNA polymerase IV [Clostridia bacterium]MBR3576289.1 DNA polymerase IV [Clostridia bacterium]
MDRTILHCDCNAFYASVECMLRPELKDVPMAVAGDITKRHGIILAKNELAKACGVKTAETIGSARKKCPDIVLVLPHHELYAEYSKKVNDIYKRYTDLVEPFGIDESWLDVTASINLFGDGVHIANEIRHAIKEEIGITVSVGVSFNKVFAKLGSDYKKPDATTVINRENYKDIVYPLPVGDLLFAGRRTTEMLGSIGIKTIGELAAADRELVGAMLGKMGYMLHDYANGIDNDPVKNVEDVREIKSVGNGMTFKTDIVTEDELSCGITALADSICSRMRRACVKCRGIQVYIKYADFKSVSKQKQLDMPTNVSKEIAKEALNLANAVRDKRKAIRMLRITGINIEHQDNCGVQLSLFEDVNTEKHEKLERLEKGIDKIRSKFGKGAITFGSALGNEIGIDEE